MPSGPVRRPPQELAFAAAIRAARVEAGLTQADVAERAGLTLHTVQSAE
jgi:transcriptional regulator with XRE-family HTH domain